MLAAVAPLLHFAPSKRQRALAGLRERAAVAGLFVEFRDLPGAELDHRATSTATRQVIYYGRRLPPSRGKNARSGSWRTVDGTWRGVVRRKSVPAGLHDLPPQILAASIDESSCGLYWREEGEAEIVDQIIATLSTWSVDIVEE
ncbi:MAG: hypothetical protein ACJAYC_000041 [Halieaceae bacterium]|jgi:hypothetical protein